MELAQKTLWELLWDYDPNGLLVVDTNLIVTLVNPALCAMFKTTPEAIIGRPVATLLDDPDDQALLGACYHGVCCGKCWNSQVSLNALPSLVRR